MKEWKIEMLVRLDVLFCLQPDYECDFDDDRSAQNVLSLYNINQRRGCNVSRWLVVLKITSCGIVNTLMRFPNHFMFLFQLLCQTLAL